MSKRRKEQQGLGEPWAASLRVRTIRWPLAGRLYCTPKIEREGNSLRSFFELSRH
jgi:hypothetical protein